MYEKFILGNSVEGESCVGKTTVIEKIKNIESIQGHGIIVVPEYSVIGQLPSFPRLSMNNVKESIQQIIDLEKRRTEFIINNLSKNPHDHVIFDRGPISCIAFEYAAEKNGYKGAALWIAEAFQKEIENKNIIVPRGVIHLTADEGFIKEREKMDSSLGKNKIISFLQDSEVIKTLKEAFDSFGEFLPEQLFLTLDTGNKKPDEVGAEVIQFIKDQPSDIENHVPDFMKYAQSLIDGKK